MAERHLDFDTVVDRRGTKSLKYDFAARRGMPEDVLPLWVADMDFPTSSYVTDAVKACAEHGIFGYSESQTPYFEVVRAWMRTHHHWEPEERWLIKTPGVVFAMAMAVKAFTAPGEAVMIQQPVYYPFSEVIEDNGRRRISSDLVLGEDFRYHMDFEDIERKIEEEGVKLFLLCSPHNPGGRVWSREELERLGDICLRHGVIVFSDEIHQDLVFEGEHHVFAGLREDFAQNCVIATSPSKTFNLAGMLISHIFIPNQTLRRRFRAEVNAAGMSQLSGVGLAAAEAAYRDGDTWYRAMLSYVRENLDFIEDYTKTHLPGVRVMRPEGTYLVWMDFRGTGLSDEEVNQRLIYKARLWLDKGSMFGKCGEGFQRINAACPRSTLAEALGRMKTVLTD